MKKKINFFKQVGYLFSSNLISLTVSSVLVLLLPRYLGTTEYGYWQLYIFYSTYTAYLSLGVSEGVFLKIAGLEYEELDKDSLRFHLWTIALSYIVYISIFFLLSNIYSFSLRKFTIIFVSLVSGVLISCRGLIFFVLQATNQMKDYSRLLIVGRLTYFFSIILLLIFGQVNFILFLIADIFGKSLSLFLSFKKTSEIFKGKVYVNKKNMLEYKENISIGYKLVLASLSSSLIVGINRFFIEKNWSIETFGKISLSLSLSSMSMIFIHSIATVFFPVLKKWEFSKMKQKYSFYREILSFILYGILILYFFIALFVKAFLPNYVESVKYMGILFPMIVFESRVVVLLNTYLKAIRSEKTILMVNLFSIMSSLILSVYFSLINSNLKGMIYSILLVLMLRSNLSEFFLSKKMGINSNKSMLSDLLVVCIFLVLANNFPLVISLMLYMIFYSVFALINRKEILNIVKVIKEDR